MTTSTHLRQLPSLQPGDSHMESLIEAAIQGHADTREAMRWLVRLLVPATQPASEVTRDEVMQVAKEATAPEWHDVVDGWHMGLDLMAFARAILALRPVQAEAQQPDTGVPDDVCGISCNCAVQCGDVYAADAERFRTLMRAIPGQIADAICGRPNVPDDDIIEAIDLLAASPAQKGGE